MIVQKTAEEMEAIYPRLTPAQRERLGERIEASMTRAHEGCATLPPALAERLAFAWGRYNLTAMLLALAPPSVERCEPVFQRECA